MNIDLNQEPKILTKKELLKHLNEVDVFNYYLDGEKVSLNSAIHSPLRKDNNPSFGFYKTKKGEIYFNDFKSGSGDFLTFVMLKYNLNYNEALSKIALDFKIKGNYIYSSVSRLENREPVYYDKEEIVSQHKTIKLGKNRRKWREHDLQFWKSFGISLSTLEKYKVEPVSFIYVNDYVIKADLYSYVYIETKDGIETYKFYQPFSKKHKWFNNHDFSVIQGWENLPNEGENLIITKSLKDVMTIVENLNIPAIALQNENLLPKVNIIKELEDRFNNIYFLYDNDYDKDVNYGQKYVSKILPLFKDPVNIVIPTKFKSKDFSDLIKNTNIKTATQIIKKWLK